MTRRHFIRWLLQAGSSGWPIRHAHDHVQGLDVDERWFWISAVDRRTRTGWVWRVDRRTLATAAERDITQGSLYHPGGLQVVGSSLWIPIAEYRPRSSARLLELDAMTLGERRSFPVPDHIGAVATDGKTHLVGANWDARQFYRWDLAGKHLERVDNRSRLEIQDMKWIAGNLYAGGVEGKACRVEMLDPTTLAVGRTWTPGTDQCYTREGMALWGDSFYFLPEDEPHSRIYVSPAGSFERPKSVNHPLGRFAGAGCRLQPPGSPEGVLYLHSKIVLASV